MNALSVKALKKPEEEEGGGGGLLILSLTVKL